MGDIPDLLKNKGKSICFHHTIWYLEASHPNEEKLVPIYIA